MLTWFTITLALYAIAGIAARMIWLAWNGWNHHQPKPTTRHRRP